MTSPSNGTIVLPMKSEKRDLSTVTETPTQRLANILLGMDVRTFIREKRDNGRAWRFIARDLYEATNGQIDVTYETLRQWYSDDQAA